MKFINFYNRLFFKLTLPFFGDKNVIYTTQGADWWAWYASDTKRWVFEEGEYKV